MCWLANSSKSKLGNIVKVNDKYSLYLYSSHRNKVFLGCEVIFSCQMIRSLICYVLIGFCYDLPESLTYRLHNASESEILKHNLSMESDSTSKLKLRSNKICIADLIEFFAIYYLEDYKNKDIPIQNHVMNMKNINFFKQMYYFVMECYL